MTRQTSDGGPSVAPTQSGRFRKGACRFALGECVGVLLDDHPAVFVVGRQGDVEGNGLLAATLEHEGIVAGLQILDAVVHVVGTDAVGARPFLRLGDGDLPAVFVLLILL